MFHKQNKAACGVRIFVLWKNLLVLTVYKTTNSKWLFSFTFFLLSCVITFVAMNRKRVSERMPGEMVFLQRFDCGPTEYTRNMCTFV